jgi:hypothetical protein
MIERLSGLYTFGSGRERVARNRVYLIQPRTRMRDPHFRYAAPEDTASWRVLTRREASDAARVRSMHGMDDRHMAILGRMYRAGVPMLIGTDLGNPYMVAGFSVHDELAITQQAGANPLVDIANARKIRGVIVGEKFLDRTALDALLETAARLAPHAWTKPDDQH